MNTMLQGSETYKRVMSELQRRNRVALTTHEAPDIVKAATAITQGIMKPQYIFSARVGSFWEKFFGNEQFLDVPASIPIAIIGTGNMRNHNQYGGQTLNVQERLEKIAETWNIPIQIIDSWAP
jgi:ABC-type uncharacterized transport system ATPase subunit